MNKVDRDAMKRAIALTRAEDEGRRRQIDHKLKTESFEAVGRFASYCCQSRALNLKPWQYPPAWVRLDEEDDERDAHHGRAAARALLRKMIDAGLSKFEPSPLEALARVGG